ncbi:hypothetical protein KEM55_006609 [Ascosphaera atra]|nr:hypothetical protein KEM55_006609 [Ascosphaera atra]
MRLSRLTTTLLLAATTATASNIGSSIVESRCAKDVYLWIVANSVSTTRLLHPGDHFSEPYEIGPGIINNAVAPSSMVDIKASLDKNAVDPNGRSIKDDGNENTPGKGVLTMSYGVWDQTNSKTMSWGLMNEVGTPFKGHQVMLNVTSRGATRNTTNARGYWGLPPGNSTAANATASAHKHNGHAGHGHGHHGMNSTTNSTSGLFWKDGVSESDEGFELHRLDDTMDLVLTLCAERPRLPMAMPYSSGAARGKARFLFW